MNQPPTTNQIAEARANLTCKLCALRIGPEGWIAAKDGQPKHESLAYCLEAMRQQAIRSERERIIAIIRTGLGCDVSDHHHRLCDCETLIAEIERKA